MIKVFGLFTSLQRPARFLASALALIVLFGCGKVPSFEATGSNDSSLSELVETPFWQVNKAGDEALVSGHSLSPYFVAAKAKSLPTNYFRDLISGRKSVNLRYGDWQAEPFIILWLESHLANGVVLIGLRFIMSFIMPGGV